MRWVITGLDGEAASAPLLTWFGTHLREALDRGGSDGLNTQVVWNFFLPGRPRPYHRAQQATFVVGVTAGPEPPGDVLEATYPLLIRSLGNHLVYLVDDPAGSRGRPPRTYFVTLERGHYTLDDGSGDYFARVLERVRPLATSHLVIDNAFLPDLPESLWQGNERTAAIAEASRRLKNMDLLPAPFPIDRLLPPADFAHLRRLFQLGGLSYGNVSVREPGLGFWMSASGVDKAHLERIGEEILLVRGYDPTVNRMLVSVPPAARARRVSVDAIEHQMIYDRFPGVGAILHVHAWIPGVVSTDVNYPCGTLELARAVTERLATLPDPTHGVVGLRNHGLTITGESLTEIFDRVGPRLVRQVPME